MEVRQMVGHKKSSCAVNQEDDFMAPTSKRHKAAVSLPTKERKERLNGKIIALQQLVSPYGKTDTASVLLEAMGYIQFLHDQLKVLSAPYLHGSPTAKMQGIEIETCRYSLRIRGLSIVPISFTEGVAQSNGADIWAPIYIKSPVFHDPISSLH